MFTRAVLAVLAGLGLTAAIHLFTESGAAGGGPEVVGNGTAMSCTDAAFTNALANSPSIITFNCGPAPVAFSISEKVINANLTIDGGGLITLSGGNANRLFIVIDSGSLTLQNIVLTNGRAEGSGFGGEGGAIFNVGTVVLTNSAIQNSIADVDGGAIISVGPLTITNSTLRGNSAPIGGALALAGTAPVTITGSELYDNHATGNPGSGAGGGAIAVYGALSLTIENSDLHDNTTAFSGGAIYSSIAGAALALRAGTEIRNNRANGSGGGIYQQYGTITLTNVILSGNQGGDGGGIRQLSGTTATLTDVTLSGNSAITGGGIFNSGTATLLNTTLSDNSVSDVGGGIFNYAGTASMTNVTLSGNAANYGGGINNYYGTATLTNVTLSGNYAEDGGGIYNELGTATLTNVTLSGNSAQKGGGINSTGPTATLTLTSVTLSSNSATVFEGGGIFNGGTATLTNVTLSGNSTAGRGGGIFNTGTATLTNATLSGNTASFSNGGGIYHYSAGGSTTLKNTIIAQSGAGGNCYKDPVSVGTIVSTGYNLSDDTSCTPYLNQGGDQNNTPAGLGPLASNGSLGPTLTHLPMPGSLAIDHGTNAGCPGTDQRGRPRPVGIACDVGSVEVQTSELATYTPTPTRTATASTTTTRTATATATTTLTATATVPGAPTATGTPTPSPTSTGGPTASRTPSPSPTATPGDATSTVPPTVVTSTIPPTMVLSTVTPTPTSVGGTAGADGFSLLTNPSGPALAQARWTPGTLQSGFRGYRLAPGSGAVTTFPSGGGLLPANATGFDDPAPGGVGCYFAGVLGGSPPGSVSYGISEVICLYRGLASGATPPNFKAQLDGDLVTLSWMAPGGQTGYVLFVIRSDGSVGLQTPGPGATSTIHDTGGATICYQLHTAGIDGRTDVLCPVPHAGTAGVAGARTGLLY